MSRFPIVPIYSQHMSVPKIMNYKWVHVEYRMNIANNRPINIKKQPYKQKQTHNKMIIIIKKKQNQKPKPKKQFKRRTVKYRKSINMILTRNNYELKDHEGLPKPASSVTPIRLENDIIWIHISFSP